MSNQVLLLLSSIGAIQSLFLAVFIFLLKSGKKTLNILLGFLFLALAMRVGKSVLWAFWEATPLWLLNLGFMAHASTAPLLFLYFYYYLYPEKTIKRHQFLHFLPSIGILSLLFYLQLDSFWYKGGYTSLLYYHLIYMLICLFLLIKKYKKTGLPLDRNWLRNLWIGLTIWNLAYFSNYVLGLSSYLLAAVLYSGIVYILSFQGLRYQGIFSKKQPKKKLRNERFDALEIKKHKESLLNLMENEQVYLESDCSLSKLSKKLAIPTYMLSHIINQEFEQNLSEFVNTYRIKEAQKKLQAPQNKQLKIASIAYDCGFNSLSSFNTAFKKITHTTPSAFREQF